MTLPASTLPALLTPRFETIPMQLRALPQWVVWEAVWQPEKGKYSKVPYNARTGAKASSTDPKTWCTFEEAKAAYERNPERYAGVGFVLTDSDPFTGVDLDSDTPKAKARGWIKHLNSYTEVSPSTKGVRVFVIGNLPPGGRKAGPVEVYDSGRFLTVTGRMHPDSTADIEERQEQLEAFHKETFPVKEKTRTASASGDGFTNPDDTELLARAFKAKNGDKIRSLYSGDTSGYAGASEADLALCSLLAYYTGEDAGRLDRLFQSSGLIRDKWNEVHYSTGETYGERTVAVAIASCSRFYKESTRSDQSRNWPQKSSSSAVDADGEEEAIADDLPVIIVTNRMDKDIAADTWTCAHAANNPPRLFARGKGIVCIGKEAETGRTLVETADAEQMLFRMRRVADYRSVRRTQDGPLETRVPPPLRIARDMLLDTEQKATLPALRGIVYAPVVGPQGDLLTTPGYHASARLYLATEGLPAAPAAHTKDEGQAAYERLFGDSGLFSEFPYDTPTDRAHAFAVALTIILRPYIGGNVPMALIEAPEQGTGKTLLARNLIGLSYPSPRMCTAPTARKTEDAAAEWTKMLVTALKDGPPVLFLDNIRGLLSSTDLEALLTSPHSWEPRLLGTNESLTVWPETLTVVATGNNAEMNRDMARRSYVIRLNAEMARPETRADFSIPNLDEYMIAHRPELLADLLIIVSAWIAAGRPEGKAVKGSFERWARVISGVLDFLEVPGFLQNEGATENLDPEAAQWQAFTQLWYQRYGSKPQSVKDLLEDAVTAEIVNDASAPGAKNRFGSQLKQKRDRVFGDYRICLHWNSDRKSNSYWLRPIDTERKVRSIITTGSTGSTGEFTLNTRDPNLANTGGIVLSNNNILGINSNSATPRNSPYSPGDEDLADPFADDAKIIITPLVLGGTEQVRATLGGDGWQETGYGATQTEALDDLRNTITTQPDDDDTRAVKLAALAAALADLEPEGGQDGVLL